MVVVLDHHLGSTRDVRGRSVGLDLTPAAAAALRELRAWEVPVILEAARRRRTDGYGA